MGESSKIQWTDATFNPWRGCDKVSPGCANCYAEKLSHRNPAVLGEWGPGAARVPAAESYWRQPIKWNRDAEREGVRRRVFCLSLGDVFEDHEALPGLRRRLGALIIATPHLDWLLLTKRPERWREASRELWVRFVDEAPLPPNVWLGTSVEDQQRADERIPHLLEAPAAVRFLSMEPLLGPVDLAGNGGGNDYLGDRSDRDEDGIAWIIIGGESGPGARPCEVAWIRGILAQCRAASVPAFCKQLGALAVVPEGRGESNKERAADEDREHRLWPEGTRLGNPTGNPDLNGRVLRLRDSKGGDMEEWAQDIRVRELPRGATGAP